MAAAYRAATETPRALAVVTLPGLLVVPVLVLAAADVGSRPLGCQSPASFPIWATLAVVLLPLGPVASAVASLRGHLRARRAVEIAWARRLPRGAVELPVVVLALAIGVALVSWFAAALIVGMSRFCF